MTAIVIEHLLDRVSSDALVGLAYIYCNYQIPLKSGHFHLSILKQLLLYSDQPLKALVDLYELHHPKGSRPLLSEVRQTFQSVIGRFSKVFVVVDALDECQGPDGREKLLNEVAEFQTENGLNLIVTSRPVPEILSKFEGCRKREISAVDEDVLNYIDGRLPHMKCRLSNQPALQESIRKTVVESVDGM